MKNYIETLKFGRPYKKQLVFIGLLAALSSGISLLYIFLLRNVIDEGIVGKDIVVVRNSILFGICIFLIREAISYFYSYKVFYISERITIDIQNRVYNHVLNLPIKFFGGESTGGLMSRILYDVYGMQQIVLMLAEGAVIDIVKIIGLSALLCYFNTKLAFVVFFTIPFSAAVILVLGRKIEEIVKSTQREKGIVYSHLQESLQGIENVKSFVAEKREGDKFGQLLEDIFKKLIKNVKMQLMQSPIHEIIKSLATVIILGLAAVEIAQGRISIGNFSAFLVTVYSFYNCIMGINSSYNKIRIGLASSERVFQILQNKTENQKLTGTKIFRQLNEGIEFKELTFSYTDGIKVLSDINAYLPAHEITVIKGPSGSGKTTLAKLLMRFYDPREGRIYFDGIDIKELDIAAVRGKIGYVSQDVVLFNTNIKDNISYGNPYAKLEEIERSAYLACIHDFISSLPQGYNTSVGEGGLLLSAGQRQRISAARALLMNPDILILDEVSSSLDKETEMKLLCNLKDYFGKKTLIIISHRDLADKFANQILVLDNGVVDRAAIPI